MRDPSAPWQPRLTLWSHLWRTALVLLISGLAWGPVAQAQWHEAHWLFWLDLGVGLLCLVLSFFRRRWPFPIAVLLTVASITSASSAGPGLLATVSLATRRVIWQVLTVGVLAVVMGQLFFTYQP